MAVIQRMYAEMEELRDENAELRRLVEDLAAEVAQMRGGLYWTLTTGHFLGGVD